MWSDMLADRSRSGWSARERHTLTVAASTFRSQCRVLLRLPQAFSTDGVVYLCGERQWSYCVSNNSRKWQQPCIELVGEAGATLISASGVRAAKPWRQQRKQLLVFAEGH